MPKISLTKQTCSQLPNPVPLMRGCRLVKQPHLNFSAREVASVSNMQGLITFLRFFAQALRNELNLTQEQLRTAEAAVVEKEEKAKMYIRHAVRETAAKVELKFQKKVAKLARRNAELERLHSSTVRALIVLLLF